MGEAGKPEGRSQALDMHSSDDIMASDGAEERPFLEIRCLGPFELYRQGKLVTPETVQRRGALTLLKILLVHEGRPVARDALADLLWPEVDPEAGANRVYVLVHALRQVMEPSNANRHWQFIRSEGDRYYFNLDSSHRLDLQEFRQDVALGERLERENRIADAIDSYEAAVKLYRGDLLEDEPYAEWCGEHRESLREILLNTLRRLASLYMDQGAPARSAELYRRALKADPLREEMHQGLMRALWMSGRRDEALRHYEVCRDILLEQLDVAPMPETEQLHRAIRENRPV